MLTFTSWIHLSTMMFLDDRTLMRTFARLATGYLSITMRLIPMHRAIRRGAELLLHMDRLMIVLDESPYR
jgi:hypothetical protein